jgi:hypothetical protein
MHSSTENFSKAITGPASKARTVYAMETPVSVTPSYEYRHSGHKNVLHTSRIELRNRNRKMIKPAMPSAQELHHDTAATNLGVY